MKHTGEPETPTYMGNAGNLMQHWTLCETLKIIRSYRSYLRYVDAHAMAPFARQRKKDCQTFDRVQNGRRPGSESVYERAWHRLVPEGSDDYPNSAAFVREIWSGRVSMLLYERNRSTAAEIEDWAQAQGRTEITVVKDDWRNQFVQSLSDADPPITMLSFDPYMYNRRRDVRDPCPGNLYPRDLELTVQALAGARRGCLVQLSTYDTNDGNSQERVLSSADTILKTGRFHRATQVQVNGKMMSLVYVRGIHWWAELANMGKRFKEWLDTHK